MTYYNRNLWILAVFNLLVAILRIGELIVRFTWNDAGSMWVSQIRILGIMMISFLLMLVARDKIRLKYAVSAAYMILVIYVWLAFYDFSIRYDTLVNAGMMTIGFSTVSIHQYYREEKHWKMIIVRSAQTLDLRVSGPVDLFHPLVIGPHLEINKEIVEAVEHFVAGLREMSKIEIYIYCSSYVSVHMQETAIEAYREHFIDEERRLLKILRNRTRRSMLLFCISMSIIFVWTYYDAIAGQSVIWTVLGNMGGFFLWEIGNTHFRHTDDYYELERALICKDAEITFM